MKSIITSIFLIIIPFYYGQNTNNNNDPHRIVPPTQETFSLSRIDYTSSTSGEFNYQFPITSNEFKIPVSLNYSSGIKVNDIGGSVGLSWQLNTGGTISRIVKDDTDENHPNWKPETVNEINDLLKIRQASSPGNNLDTEYDWFSFSISNGLSGKFYIDENLNAFIESNEKVKIEITDKTVPPVSLYGKLLEFKITDKTGNEYFFGGSDTTIENTRYESIGPDQHAVTGWYLHRIKYIDNKEVFLHYTLEDLQYFNSIDASFRLTGKCPAEGHLPAYSDVIKTKSIIRSSRPKVDQIVYTDKEINFIYQKSRYDIFSNTTTKLLTGIEIKANNRVVERYSMEYYDPISPVAASYYNISTDETSTRYRYFLKSINQDFKEIKTQFEYDRLNLIPSRFSLNSDYYGYANGKNNYSPFPKIGKENNFGIFLSYANVFPISILSADNSVNSTLSSVGNLTRIIHPTKGISEIQYEPNQSFETINEVVRQKENFVVNYNKCNLTNSTPIKSFTFVSDGSNIEFEGNAFFDDWAMCGEPDAIRDIHSLKIINITNNNTTIFSQNKKISESFKAIDGTQYYPISTQTGHTYKVEYSVSSRIGAVGGTLKLLYNNTVIPTQKFEFYGGSRVAEIQDHYSEGDVHRRKFYYSDLINIPTKKTSIQNFNPSIILAKKTESSLLCGNGSTLPQVVIIDVILGSTNNMLSNFTDRNNKIFYSNVTELIDNKSAIEKKYTYNDDIDAYIGRLPLIYSMPESNYNSQFRNGLLKEEVHYKFENGQFETLQQQKIINNYVVERKNKSYVFRENFMYTPHPGEDPLINISYGSYDNYYGFNLPTKVDITDFIDGQELIKTIGSYYEEPSHNQLTSQTITFPDLATQETTYSYAHEKNNQKLIAANMVGIPLQTEVKKNGKTISKTEIKYDDPLNFLPSSVLSYDRQSPTISQTELTYDIYDTKGNLLQYTTKSGIATVIIWGYNQTQPIAKIEGATYVQVQNLAGAIITASNNDATDPTKEGLLLTALDNFRKEPTLANYQISTYTYNPLIGITSVTPPSGIREVYKYDTANRLQSIVDTDGKILKEYKYNYKP